MFPGDKQALRQHVRDISKQYPEPLLKERSKDIIARIEAGDAFRRAINILVYWSMPGEVFTHDFIQRWYENKRILLPCVRSEDLIIKTFKGRDRMVTGSAFGIAEPDTEDFLSLHQIDLVIVPGLAFDRHMNRLGRGKGYYDRLLTHMSAHKLGVCFDFQLFDEIPTGHTDVKMDDLISG